MPRPSSIRRLAALSVGVCLLVGAGAGAAQAARTIGILPPRNPSSDCSRGGAPLAAITACRAVENVGRVRLPRNWAALTVVQKGFVLINLERVNRGLAPIVGLSAPLNQLAANGAANGTDPSFPAGGFLGGGAIWASTPSVESADYLWMYEDGPGGGNLDCSSAGAAGCWGHRDIILWNRAPGRLVAGGGYARREGGSYAYIVLADYSTANLTFTWARELKYFAEKPRVEPARPLQRSR